MLDFPVPDDYLLHATDDFHFGVPYQGFWYTESDCWVQIMGKFARIGVTDFVQRSLADISLVTPPPAGAVVEQFSEIGLIKSDKAVFQVISPVSGRVLRANPALNISPALINENPYELGWVAELELTDSSVDQALLLTPEQYLGVLKRKVAELRA